MKKILLVSLILLGVLCISVGSQEQERRRKRPLQGRPNPRRPPTRRPVYEYDDDYYDDDEDYDDEPLPPRRKPKPHGTSFRERDREPERNRDRYRDRELEREQELERFRQYERDRASSLCPEPTGFFPDAGQCDKYYECTNWKMVTKLCADGLAFVEGAPKLEKCDYIHNVDCKERTALQEPNPNVNCVRQNGYFEHKTECKKFYQCAGGVSTTQQCPTGLLFSKSIGTCDYPNPEKGLVCRLPSQTSTSSSIEKRVIPKNETAGTSNTTEVPLIPKNETTVEQPPSSSPRRKIFRRTTTTTTEAPPAEETEESE